MLQSNLGATRLDADLRAALFPASADSAPLSPGSAGADPVALGVGRLRSVGLGVYGSALGQNLTERAAAMATDVARLRLPARSPPRT